MGRRQISHLTAGCGIEDRSDQKRYSAVQVSKACGRGIGRKRTSGLIALLALYSSMAMIWIRYATLLSTVLSPSKTSLAPRLFVRPVREQERLQGLTFKCKNVVQDFRSLWHDRPKELIHFVGVLSHCGRRC